MLVILNGAVGVLTCNNGGSLGRSQDKQVGDLDVLVRTTSTVLLFQLCVLNCSQYCSGTLCTEIMYYLFELPETTAPRRRYGPGRPADSKPDAACDRDR